MFQVGGQCGHCGNYHPGPCPRIKAIEYHPNGTVKRVEYFDARPTVTTHISPPPFPVCGNDLNIPKNT